MPLNLEATDADKAYEKQAQTVESAPVEQPAPKESAAPEKPEAAPTEKQAAPAEPADKPAEKTAEPVKAEEKPAEKQVQRAKVPAPKLVPVGAMLEERHQRQAYEKELAAMRAELETLKKPPAAPPDPNLDPDGYTRYELNQLKQQVQETAKETEEQKKTREQQAAFATRYNAAKEYETASLDEFEKARPEEYQQYKVAWAHYRDAMRRFLPSVGIRDTVRIEMTIDDLLLRAIEDAKTNGENAAERVFDLATSVGFKLGPAKPKTPAEPAAATQQQSSTEDMMQQVNDKLSVLTEGQKASKSIAASSKSSQGLTLDELVASAKGASLLEETDLDKLSARKARKLFGE